MKRLFLCICVLLLVESISVFSAIFTVSNNPGIPAQYSTVQDAVSSASDGDTVYVHGSPNNYTVGSLTISKPLTIIGNGFNPSKPTLNLTYFYGTFYISVSNVKLCGIKTDAVIISSSYSNITFFRCSFNGNVTFNYNSNIEINGCWNSGYLIQLNNSSNVIISNSMFYGGSRIGYSNQPSVVISNNIFHHSYTTIGAIDNFAYGTIQNNIFINYGPASVTYSIFNNNLTYNAGQNTLPYGSNTGADNIINQNPLFTTDGYYHLQTGSPAINTGTDGSDLGLYGGIFTPYDERGEPEIPQIRIFNIQNPVVGSEGELRYNVKAEKKD